MLSLPDRAAAAAGAGSGGDGACDACLRRTRLLQRLAPHVERARHERRLGGLLALSDADLLAAIGGRRREELELAMRSFDAHSERAAARAVGLTLICRHTPAYPERLRDADDAPAVLHLAGDPCGLPGPGPVVAIVGSRRASPYGLEMARSLARGLAAAGVPVVSGMALGIDSAAHAGALEAGGRTVAVLAGGADSPYPRSKAPLYRRLRQSPGCCVISEMPPGFTPFKWGFPARNRLIAGLADATIVVEAAERSGSLITAEMAQDLGRLVGAVPGAVTNPLAGGANALLRDGAELVRDAQDVLDALLGAGAPRVASGPDAGTVPVELQPLFDRLSDRPATSAALLAPGEAPDGVVAGLVELELLGFARRVVGGAYVRAAGCA